MITMYSIKPGQSLTQKELNEIAEAKKHPITFDTDCCELTPAMVEAFKKAASRRKSTQKA